MKSKRDDEVDGEKEDGNFDDFDELVGELDLDG